MYKLRLVYKDGTEMYSMEFSDYEFSRNSFIKGCSVNNLMIPPEFYSQIEGSIFPIIAYLDSNSELDAGCMLILEKDKKLIIIDDNNTESVH
jgi:hypothetical protein